MMTTIDTYSNDFKRLPRKLKKRLKKKAIKEAVNVIIVQFGLFGSPEMDIQAKNIRKMLEKYNFIDLRHIDIIS